MSKTPRPARFRWATPATWVAGLVLAGVLAWAFLAGDGVDRSIVYTIDYGNDVPFHFKGEDGAPTGLAVELVREAARSKNIRLEWADERAGGTEPHALRVLITVRTNLLKELHLTEPYLQGRSSFIVASNAPIRKVGDLEGKRIGFVNYAIHRVNLAKVLQTYSPAPAASSREAMEKLAKGEVDAVFLNDYAIEPACLNVPLPFPARIMPSTAPIGRMALASLPQFAQVADTLRDGIREMAVDGRMGQILDRWGFFPNLTTDHRDELVKERRKVVLLQVVSALLLLTVGLSGWLIAKLRFERRSARAAEQTQSATLDALPAHIALLDANGAIIAVNKSWRTFGRANLLQSADYCVGQNYLHICEQSCGTRSEEAALAAAGIRRVLEGGAKEFTLEYPCHSPTEKRWCRLMVTPLNEEQRNGVVVMHVDITERKLSELALQSSELKSRAIVESTPVPMAVNDDDQRITYLNHAFINTFGYTLEDIPTLGDWWPKAYPDPDYRAWVAETWQAELNRARLSGGGFQPIEVQVRAKDGTERVALAAAALFQGSMQGEHLVVLIDITERKRQESERQSLEAQLRQAQKMEAVGVLAGGIAHDFNNILAAIMANASLAALDLRPSDPVHECLSEIQKASDRAAVLIRQILAFSRKEKGEQRVLDLSPVIEEAARMLRSTIPAGVELVTRFERAPMALADPTEIHQVVINLGSNACHAMDGRPGEILMAIAGVTVDEDFARAHPALRAGHYALMTVKDTGQGMTAEVMEHIFDPFFTTKEVGQGTGLGLAVVHGIMKSHRGAILVQSKPGEGATFELYFPAAEDQRPVEAEPASTPKEIQGGNRRILFVDDEEQMVRVAVMLLERRGFRVSGFTRPEAGLEAFEAAPDSFDLVVTDYNMPGYSGVELTRKIRQLRPLIPVVLMSGFITEPLRQQAESAGVSLLAGKPMPPDELLQTIQRFIRQ